MCAQARLLRENSCVGALVHGHGGRRTGGQTGGRRGEFHRMEGEKAKTEQVFVFCGMEGRTGTVGEQAKRREGLTGTGSTAKGT